MDSKPKLNKNPIVENRLEAIVWVQVIRALKASPDAGNYLVEAATLAFEESLTRAGVEVSD